MLALAAPALAQAPRMMVPAAPVPPSVLAIAKPDLIPTPGRLPQLAANGWISITNQGKGNAAASVAVITCQKAGNPGGGGCPEVSNAQLTTDPLYYHDPAYPSNPAFHIPAIKAGTTFSHRLTFFKGIAWPPGTYLITITADAKGAVSETNEGNNVAATTKLVK